MGILDEIRKPLQPLDPGLMVGWGAGGSGGLVSHVLNANWSQTPFRSSETVGFPELSQVPGQLPLLGTFPWCTIPSTGGSHSRVYDEGLLLY